MVSKNTLRKLSDRELENYLKPESSFVPKAIQMAFEILTERKLEQVTGGDVRSNKIRLWWENIFFNKK